MGPILLIIGLVVIYSLQTLFCKFYSDNYPGKTELSSPVLCVTQSIAIALLSFAFAGFRFEISLLSFVFGALNAAVLFGYNTSLIKAGERGSYAFMNMMMLFGGIFVPLVYTSITIGTFPSLIQCVAIVTMIVACLLMNIENVKLGGAKISYFVFCVLLFLFNGLYGVLLKAQEQHNSNESQEMVIISYGLMGVIALIQLLCKEKKATLKAFCLNKKSAIYLALFLIISGLAVNVLVLLLEQVDATVLYTVDNGGVMMLSAVYSITLFKEKATPLKIIGIIIAIASLCVLGYTTSV
ncbi:MAG: EamA family transporter [Clostridia bacterium]|nr:EamA family transporter [Clostridia bacterium]